MAKKEMKTMSTLGERVKKERIKLGMTQDELAKKAGYSSRTSIII